MASKTLAERVVAKVIADHLEGILAAVQDPEICGAGTVLGVLRNAAKLTTGELTGIVDVMREEFHRQTVIARLPDRWRDVGPVFWEERTSEVEDLDKGKG